MDNRIKIMLKKIEQKTGVGLAMIAMIGLVFFQACGSEEPDMGEREQVSVETDVAGLVSFEESIPYSGSVISTRSAKVSTKIMGEIIEMDLEIGDSVQKGDQLMRIRSEQLTGQKERILANMDEANAALNNAKINFDRIEALYNQESATEKEFDDMKTELSMAEARVEALQGSLKEVEELIDYTKLVAPFDATVAARMADVGDMANPGQPLLQLNETGRFKIRITVSEQDISRFNEGDSALFSVPSAGIVNAEATVLAVNMNGSAASRQFDVELTPVQQEISEQLNAGQFTSVMLKYDSEPLISVKSNAIVHKGQLTGLYTVNDNDQILLRWVRTGKQKADMTEILSGLKAGERYIIPGEEPLREGLYVAGNQ